ncbi:MAG: YbaB/EbfC family nucleoid-associated protein [Clostridia bacterium]|nr:YbaB/EbfC family nucleoid-associated protein [Clostridia bacterium]MBQ2690527.1 YbaB/EbfC family nucleoid-associated protein [Clostridia bacterium]MBQ3062233.1 YbaB/EbfC family nucleoid-associated protein [Clostridia bacterium]MBQ5813630.1 YbaB/EbfC family nucleoid-associated protein [Clostridia bacterium]MBQ9966365.1 YbaB/EbfC family nucleoid-associated protein [Clostridia bacterium]
MKPGRMPGGFNMNALMKQAQKMQADMEKMQAELEAREFTASAGGGAVTAVVCGKLLKSIKINPEVVDADDVEMLEDLVMAAVNEAMTQCEETTAREMNKITGGMKGLPF